MKAKRPQETPSFSGSAFRRYGPELQHYLLRRLRRSQDAEDVVQEVFMRLLRIGHGEFVRNPRAYIYGIALHVVREFRVRAEKAGTWLTFEPEAVRELAEYPDEVRPDDIPDRLSLQRQLEQALARLPPAYRTIFLLHKRDGYSYEEIARQLGLSVHTVDKYLVRAKVLIRAMEWDL